MSETANVAPPLRCGRGVVSELPLLDPPVPAPPDDELVALDPPDPLDVELPDLSRAVLSDPEELLAALLPAVPPSLLNGIVLVPTLG